MRESDDHKLLSLYAGHQSETAFATLVERYLNLVYSAALRQVGNPHHAEEITQAVFVLLARKSGRLGENVILSGWLYHTARLTAANFLRSEIHRARREQEACMQSTANEPEPDLWPRLAPLLEQAMAGLDEKDRDAVVLRFFEGKKMHEVGAALGTSEEAAKKRISRAVEKLQRFFLKYGVTSTTAAIAGAMAANSVQAAPAVLAKTTTTFALAKGAAVSGSTLTFSKGALKFMAWTKTKNIIIASAVAILAAGTITSLVIEHQRKVAATSLRPTEFPRSSWGFAGYATPEATAQSLFWALREGDDNAFQAYLKGFTPALQAKLGGEAQRRGSHAFAELGAHEIGGVTSYRILKKIAASDSQAQLQIQFGGTHGPIQILAFEKMAGAWKVTGQ